LERDYFYLLKVVRQNFGFQSIALLLERKEFTILCRCQPIIFGSRQDEEILPLGHKTEHSLPSTAVVKNEWSYTSTAMIHNTERDEY
jgi:hypothetical protein